MRHLSVYDTYGHRDALGARVHALHVHVRPEQGHLATGVSVRLETFEETVGIVEDGRARLEGEGAVWESVSDGYTGCARRGEYVQGWILGAPQPSRICHGTVSIWSVWGKVLRDEKT